MFVRMLQTLATPDECFVEGEVYYVSDQIGHSWTNCRLAESIKRTGIQVDVCIGTGGTYKHWQQIADGILEVGCTFAVLGNEDAPALDGSAIHIGKLEYYDHYDALVDLLEHCSLFITSQSDCYFITSNNMGVPSIMVQSNSDPEMVVLDVWQALVEVAPDVCEDAGTTGNP
jgi:hypothetical protein